MITVLLVERYKIMLCQNAIILPDIRAVKSAAAIVADTINSCQVSVKCISRLTNKNAPDTTPMQKNKSI